MKLKDIVDNTELISQNIKGTKSNINSELVLNGGKAVVDLTEVPNELIKISKNYNRMAEGNFQARNIKTGNLNIPLNLSFKQNLFVFEIESKKISESNFGLEFSTSESKQVRNGRYRYITRCTINEITKDYLKLYFEFRDTLGYDLNIHWIAIG